MVGMRALAVPALLVAVALAWGAVAFDLEHLLAVAFGAAVLVVAFVRAEAGLYLVLLSMLLSPEFALGPAALAERRAVVVRLEDLLLFAIGLSWLARTAVNKELGLVARTPLNRWIAFYALSALGSTLVGYLAGTVKTPAGFFYVLKYVEYFVVYYLTVNHLHHGAQARRLVAAAFLTAAVVSVIGLAQIPSGQRVSAPFEGEAGEPNTFGGYLLFMMAVAAGIALETERVRLRAVLAGLIGLMALPFLFTLSRASYLGAPVAALGLALLASRRRPLLAALTVLAVAAPLGLPSVVPEPVVRRVRYTFQPEAGQTTVRVGRVAFDPSTSERLVAMEQALQAWTQRPLLGWGVTGFRFVDAQYARTLAETGLVGVAALVGLLGATLRAALNARRRLRNAEARGLAPGFVAGTAGLLVHAVGANTFIIVRIMEPFWFFAGVVVALPTLVPGAEPAAVPGGRRPRGVRA
jgi:O-antigen ligase